ncbi:winged helix-turn-helix domain-containing protein [Streptomyces sp. NPDC008132]|uniref:winged helix-turn-helix domain-containing protein n=2 Tax=unclassified Streptomyces TaxID=2593676 RepID=UPI0036E86263
MRVRPPTAGWRTRCGPRRGGHADFHVSYSVSGATRLMHRFGFSPQVPARRVAERGEQAVTAWKEVTWAEVKESGRPAGATSAWTMKQGSPGSRPEVEPGAGAGARRS